MATTKVTDGLINAMGKGGDISSASPTVIDVDGGFFDIVGTTSFSAFTVASGRLFTCQFDGALTITHGSGIELSGAANITTATGDRLTFYSVAANTVVEVSRALEAAAGGGAWSVLTSGTFSSSSALNITSITKETKFFLFDVTVGTNGAYLKIRTSTNGGSSYDSGGSDYHGNYSRVDDAYNHTTSTLSGTGIFLLNNAGGLSSSAGYSFNCEVTLFNPTDTANFKGGNLVASYREAAADWAWYSAAWCRAATTDNDAIHFLPPTCTFNGSYVVTELN